MVKTDLTSKGPVYRRVSGQLMVQRGLGHWALPIYGRRCIGIDLYRQMAHILLVADDLM